MKKVLTILIGLAVAGAIVAFVMHMHAKTAAMREEAAEMVNDAVIAISDGWNADAFVKRAEPGLVQAMNKSQGVDTLFDIYRKLGSLQAAPDCNYKDSSESESNGSDYTSLTFTCDVTYQNGPATILITVRESNADPQWRIYYLNISSPFFTEEGYQRTK